MPILINLSYELISNLSNRIRLGILFGHSVGSVGFLKKIPFGSFLQISWNSQRHSVCQYAQMSYSLLEESSVRLLNEPVQALDSRLLLKYS